MNIDSVADVKVAAALAHVSQWEPSIHKYRPDWDPAAAEATKKEIRGTRRQERRPHSRGVPDRLGIQPAIAVRGDALRVCIRNDGPRIRQLRIIL